MQLRRMMQQNRIVRKVTRKVNRLFGDPDYFEHLPLVSFETLFPEYAQATLTLSRISSHITGVRLNELTYLAFLAGHFSEAKIFEIGTSVGRTTLNLALNVPPNGHVYSLDLSQDYNPDTSNVQPYHSIQQSEVADFQRAEYLAGTHLPITLLTGDSTLFDFSPYKAKMNVVFIDGGHTVDVVLSDSRNAFDLLSPDGGVILWHDYWSFNMSDVVKAINTVAKDYPIKQIANTRMAIFDGRKR